MKNSKISDRTPLHIYCVALRQENPSRTRRNPETADRHNMCHAHIGSSSRREKPNCPRLREQPPYDRYQIPKMRRDRSCGNHASQNIILSGAFCKAWENTVRTLNFYKQCYSYPVQSRTQERQYSKKVLDMFLRS